MSVALSTLKFLAIAALAAYLAALALLFFNQRRMMYFPDARTISPGASVFSRAQARELRTTDGETLIAWYAQPGKGQPLILYFHGNAGSLFDRAERFAALTRTGAGLLAVNYRGYGGSTGSPSEEGLIADGRAAYAAAINAGADPRRIILMGESLGTGVAVALAAELKSSGVVLEAPFSSTVDVAAQMYWMFPVRWLMKDQFRSSERIAAIRAPLLVIHGTADPVMPIRFGERLFAAAAEPKAFLRVEGAGHQPMDRPEILLKVLDWIEARMRAS